MSDLRYPIGQFTLDSDTFSDEQRDDYIDRIAATPAMLRDAVAGLTDQQLDTPYRPDGWTVRQVVHHLPDSHLNSYIRFKLALTEEEPTIKPYNEDRWAHLADTGRTPIEVSLALLDALHERFVTLLRSLTPEQFARTFNHPEQGIVSLNRNVAIYAWHGPHHVAQITALRERMGWDTLSDEL
jgi:uncharacterized damage-inducible protein DinB